MRDGMSTSLNDLFVGMWLFIHLDTTQLYVIVA